MVQPLFIKTNSFGFSLLPTILAVSAILIVLGQAIFFIGVTSRHNVIAQRQSRQAGALVNSCLEEALYQIRRDNGFSGAGDLIIGNDTCSYAVEVLSGENRNITALATVGRITRRGKASINDIDPVIHITQWQQIGN